MTRDIQARWIRYWCKNMEHRSQRLLAQTFLGSKYFAQNIGREIIVENTLVAKDVFITR